MSMHCSLIDNVLIELIHLNLLWMVQFFGGSEKAGIKHL